MKRRRIILLSIITLVLVGVFGWKGYGWWLKHKLERYRAELVAKGEKLTVSELLEDRPALKHNSADLFYEAQAHLPYGPVMVTNPPPMMRLILPGKALVGWRQRVLVSSTWDNATNTWDELAAAGYGFPGELRTGFHGSFAAFGEDEVCGAVLVSGCNGGFASGRHAVGGYQYLLSPGVERRDVR
jgi:hypothetical protein